MNKKMMVMPFLFLILMVVPMVDAREVNETVVDIPDDVLVILPPDDGLVIIDDTEPDLASIQLQLDNIYAGMMMHDTLIMNGRSSIRELNTTLNDAIMDIERSLRLERVRSDVAIDYAFNELSLMLSNQLLLIDVLETMILDLQGQLDLQEVYIVELGEEMYRQRQELVSERAMRNNITIMFGVFCLVVIGATVVINKK